MNQNEYKSKLSAFRKELAELEGQKAELESRIEALEVVVSALESLSGEEIREAMRLDDKGFTDACREVLQSDYRLGFREARDIRDALIERGFGLGHYTNPLASVHTILKRLVKQDEAQIRQKGSKTLYRFKPKYFPRLPKEGVSTKSEKARG